MSYLLLFTFITRSFSPWWPLGFLIFSQPLKIFHVVLPTNSSLSSALALCRSFSRWASPACRPLYFFSIFQIWGHVNTIDNNGYRNNFRFSVFVFIDSLVVSASQDADGYAISRQNNLEFHLGCHTCWLSHFTLVCLWCGRTVSGSSGHVITKISRMGRLPNVLTHGAPICALRARGAPLIFLQRRQGRNGRFFKTMSWASYNPGQKSLGQYCDIFIFFCHLWVPS